MKKFKTKIEKFGVPVGSPVLYDPDKDNKGKTGKLLCTVPIGGALFYTEDELEPNED